MNNYFMSGKLMHKASDHNTKRCEVEKWVFLPHSDFERLKAKPYQEHEAITAARDLMYHRRYLIDTKAYPRHFYAVVQRDIFHKNTSFALAFILIIVYNSLNVKYQFS